MRSRRRLIDDLAGIGALRQLASGLMLLLGLALMTGCATTMSFGSMPRVEQLPTLKIGISSANEVVSTLGMPRGRGQVRFAADQPGQQVWLYEYTQSDGKKVKLKMLLVFMEEDVYAGYMWFSSGQLLESKQ